VPDDYRRRLDDGLAAGEIAGSAAGLPAVRGIRKRRAETPESTGM